MVYYEDPDPLLKVAKKHQEAALGNKTIPESKSNIIPAFEYDDSEDLYIVAIEKYPLHNLPQIGVGSDRRVYDLGDGKVIKVAKNARGLLQNSYEVPDYVLRDLLPKYYEHGLDYVVAEKLPTDKKRATKLLKPLKNLYFHDFDKKTEALQIAFENLGISNLLDYDVLFNDLKRPQNWGFRGDKMVLIDAASISKEVTEKDALAAYKSDWKNVLRRRKDVLRKMKSL